MLGWIYHDKFGGKSPREFFMEASRESLDIGIAFFSKSMAGKDLTHVFVPNDWSSPAQRFKFFITSLDDYFYSEVRNI